MFVSWFRFTARPPMKKCTEGATGMLCVQMSMPPYLRQSSRTSGMRRSISVSPRKDTSSQTCRPAASTQRDTTSRGIRLPFGPNCSSMK